MWTNRERLTGALHAPVATPIVPFCLIALAACAPMRRKFFGQFVQGLYGILQQKANRFHREINPV
jgi:hypothetical protein